MLYYANLSLILYSILKLLTYYTCSTTNHRCVINAQTGPVFFGPPCTQMHVKCVQIQNNDPLRSDHISSAYHNHHHHHHFWQAPLRVHSAERRHQSPEWTVLSQVNCVVHIEIAGFQILLNGFHPCNTRTSQWSPPVSCGGSC